MSEQLHRLAPHQFPFFVTSPSETDGLLVAMGLFLLAAIVGIGVFSFRLHSLPEQLAHGGQKVQFEIVAVLGLIALFTHNHAFWIAALLLALVPMPDFVTPLASMARSLGRIAGDPAPVVVPESAGKHGPAEPEAASDLPNEVSSRTAHGG